ncbi:DUF2171 domain-containing protein [Novosphingobium sp.]|uniref:DUF2171 domain-containing protein n=1 Tax=Novosphingobium sp. TaxID=1874826 RepID=UPI00286E5C1D|nr:DUF2171 domain-containing protein [Novosphingobium sp.]
MTDQTQRPQNPVQNSGQTSMQNQSQDSSATGQQQDGTFGQRQDNAQGGFASGQQQQFEAGDAGQFRDQLREQMDVVDANGDHCGTIDSIDGDRIKLTRNDSTDGQHHYIEIGQVAGIEGGQVRLNSTSQAGDADSNAADNFNG